MPYIMLKLLPTSVVGSYATPSWLYSALEDIHEGKYGRTDIQETFDDAANMAIRDQERAGVDVITDGEMRRWMFVQGFYKYFQGLEPEEPLRKMGVYGYDSPVRASRPRGKRGYRWMFPAVLEAKCDQLVLEFANREMAEIELWKEFAPKKELGAGLVDIKSFYVETPKDIAERIRKTLKYVPAEQLWINQTVASSNCRAGCRR